MKSYHFIAKSLLITVLAFATTWNADVEKAKVTFSVKGPFGTVHGSFTGMKATIKFDEKDLSGSSFSASMDAKTVSTGIGLRNSDLRNEEIWLNTDKFPLISYKSNKIEKTGNGFKAIGELTLKELPNQLRSHLHFHPKKMKECLKDNSRSIVKIIK